MLTISKTVVLTHSKQLILSLKCRFLDIHRNYDSLGLGMAPKSVFFNKFLWEFWYRWLDHHTLRNTNQRQTNSGQCMAMSWRHHALLNSAWEGDHLPGLVHSHWLPNCGTTLKHCLQIQWLGVLKTNKRIGWNWTWNTEWTLCYLLNNYLILALCKHVDSKFLGAVINI